MVNRQILTRIDNITAIAYINKMGGIKHKHLNEITKELREWAIQSKNWLFAEYVASKDNVADEGSRITNLYTEWELSNHHFKTLCKEFSNPSIDLFATRINTKCPRFCSWERDPEAFVINALTIDWKGYFWYAFPPFSLIPKILRKIKEEGSRGILIVPKWTCHPWYPMFMELLVSRTVQFGPSSNLLLSPCRERTHPLAAKLILVSGVVLGDRSTRRT